MKMIHMAIYFSGTEKFADDLRAITLGEPYNPSKAWIDMIG